MNKITELLNKLIELVKEIIGLSQAKEIDQAKNNRIKEICDFIDNLVYEGSKNPFTKVAYMNFRESAGKNRSTELDAMIKRNGGNLGDAYCMFGQQDILRAIEKQFNVKFDLPKGGSTQSFWRDTKAEYKTQNAGPYYIGIYKRGTTWTGHAVQSRGTINSKEFSTFEFNTSPSAGQEIVRDGEGCYFKIRPFAGYGDMKLLGFVDIFKAMKDL